MPHDDAADVHARLDADAPIGPNALAQLSIDRIRMAVDRLGAMQWSHRQPLNVQAATTIVEPIGVKDAASLTFRDVQPGESFGEGRDDWRQQWFRIAIPGDVPAGERYLLWDAQGESTVHVAGTAWAGLDCAHPHCRLPADASELLVEMCLWQTAIWNRPKPITSTGCRFESATLAIRDKAAHGCWVDFRVLVELMDSLNMQRATGNVNEGGDHHHRPSLVSVPPRLRYLVDGLTRAVDALDTDGIDVCQTILSAMYAELPADARSGLARLVGHSHLDLVWKWPEIATRRKNVHTLATAVELLERYPEATYVQSQPWLLDRLAEDDPALSQRLQALIDDGRLEVEGMLGVESDVVLTSGETLARAFAIGQRHTQRLTGRLARCVWLPDDFGFSGCIPTLVRLAGGDAFYTQKMSWNRVTKFPHTSFVWQANDGTGVLAYIGVAHFNCDADVAAITAGMRRHRQVGVAPETLFPIGFGDGGGGITEDELDRVRRQSNLAGLPPMQWSSVRRFFDELAEHIDVLPRFRGEIYLEAHRGTPTSQRDQKRWFRAAERSMQALEAVRAVRGAGPTDEAMWERILLASFHDAIPGSSIRRVYEELNPQLEEVATRARQQAIELLGGAAADAPLSSAAAFFNPLAVDRRVVIEDGDAAYTVELPSMAAAANRPLEGLEQPTFDGQRAASDRATIDFEGSHVRSMTIDGQEIAMAGPPMLMLHPDHPTQHDAWEVELDDLRIGRPLTLSRPQVAIESPTRLIVRQSFDDECRGTLSWILDAGMGAIGLALDVAWSVSHRWLRFVMPTQYRGRDARFGGPFGSALRPQVGNYEQDAAMFEGPASRWAAVFDEGGEGCAIVTREHYGFGANNGELHVSLLRAPRYPDDQCDVGQHRLRWSVMPWRATSEADRASTALAAETMFGDVVPADEASPSWLGWEQLGSLVPSWVQPLDGGVICRAHEAIGRRGEAILRLPPGTEQPYLVDLLGRRINRDAIGSHEPGQVAIRYQPYDILSVFCPLGDSLYAFHLSRRRNPANSADAL